MSNCPSIIQEWDDQFYGPSSSKWLWYDSKHSTTNLMFRTAKVLLAASSLRLPLSLPLTLRFVLKHTTRWNRTQFCSSKLAVIVYLYDKPTLMVKACPQLLHAEEFTSYTLVQRFFLFFLSRFFLQFLIICFLECHLNEEKNISFSSEKHCSFMFDLFYVRSFLMNQDVKLKVDERRMKDKVVRRDCSRTSHYPCLSPGIRSDSSLLLQSLKFLPSSS